MDAATAPTTAVPARKRDHESQTLKVVGWVLALGATIIALAGAGVLAVHLTQRDDDGYFSSDSEQVTTAGYALTSEELDLGDLGEAKRFVNDAAGKVRVTATATNGEPLFVGIAPKADVDRYLRNVSHSVVTDIDGDVNYANRAGRAPASPPTAQQFWTASSTGAGTQTTTWKIHDGRWAAVVMNADGSRTVSADVKVGVKTTLVFWAGIGLLVIGLLGGGAAAAAFIGSRRK